MRRNPKQNFSSLGIKMEKVFIISVLVTFFFVATRVIEMKYIEREWKPLKFLVRDALTVFGCSAAACFVYFNMDVAIGDFLNVVTDGKSSNMNATQVFTDEPGF